MTDNRDFVVAAVDDAGMQRQKRLKLNVVLII